MVATQCPEELRLAHKTAQWQPCSTQSHHISHGHTQQPESQRSIISARFHRGGQHVVYANQNWSSGVGPCKSIQTAPQLSQHSNSSCLSFPSLAALKGDSPEIATQPSPLQDMYSVAEDKKTTSQPMLQASLKDRRYCKRQVKGTLESITRGWAEVQNMNHSRPNRNHPSSPTQEWQDSMKAFIEEMVAEFRRTNVERASSNIAANQPTTVATKAGEENSSTCSKPNAEPIPESKGEAADCPTSSLDNYNTEHPRILRKVAATRKKDEDETRTTVPDVPLDKLAEDQVKSSINSKDTVKDTTQLPGVSRPLKGRTKEHELDKGILSVDGFGKKHGVVHFSEELKTTFVSEEKISAPVSKVNSDQQQCKIFGQKLISHSKLSSSVDKVQIQDDPSVPTSKSRKLEKRRYSERLGGNARSVFSPPELSVARSKNEVKEQTGQLKGNAEETFVIRTIHNPEYEDISDDSQMEGLTEEAIVKKHINNPEYEDISDDGQIEGLGEEAIALNIVNGPQYEDISDDNAQPATKLPRPHTEESSFSTPLEDLRCKFASEDENSKAGNVSVERLSQVTKPTSEQSLKMGVSAPVQDLAQMKKQISAYEERNQKKPVSPKIETFDMERLNSRSCFNEADDENRTVLLSSAVLRNEVLDDHTDDEDDWIVIPITISDLRLYPEDENQEGLEIVQFDNGDADTTEKTTNTNRPGSKPEQISPVSNLEVFETVDSFVQATEVQIMNRFEVPYCSSPNHNDDDTKELHVPQTSRERLSEDEDSYETEDSCDYPSDSKHNHLTVSRTLLDCSSVSPTPGVDVPLYIDEGEEQVTTGQTKQFIKFKEKLKQLIGKGLDLRQNKTCGQNISENTDNLSTEVDPEGETTKRKAKREFSSASKTGEDTLSSQHGRNSSATVDPECRKGVQNYSLPSANLEAPQCQSTYTEAKCKGIMQEAQLPHNTEQSGLLETKAEHESVRRKTEKPAISNSDPIIIESDSEGESDPNYIQKAKRRGSGLEARDDPSCAGQQPPHLRFKLYYEGLEKRIQNLGSDLLIKIKADSKRLHQEVDRIIIDTDSEEEDVNGKKKTKRPSSSSSEIGYLVEPPSQRNEATHASSSKTDSQPARNKSDLQRNSHAESPIIVSSDSDDDSHIDCSKEKRKRSITPPPSQQLSNLPTENIEAMEDMSSDVTCNSSDEEVVNKHPGERTSNTKRFFPTTSEDSDDTVLATKHKITESEPVNPLCVANKTSEKDRLSSEHNTKKPVQVMDGKAETAMCANPVIPRLFVSNSNGHDGCLEFKGIDETQTLKNKVCKKDEQRLNRRKGHVKVAKPPLVSRQLSLPNHVGLSTSSSSLPSTSGPQTDARRSSASASSLPLSGVSKETLNPTNPPRSEQSTSTPRKHLSSSRLARSHSLSSSSTIDPPCSPTIAPLSSGREKVKQIWGNNHIDTPFRRRGYGKEVGRPRNDDSSREGTSGHNQSESSREARPEQSHSGLMREARPESHLDKKRARQTHSSLGNIAPLMKKSLTDYKWVPKATNRDPPREQCGTVGENYKWSQRKKPKKGPSRDEMQ